MKKAFDIGVPCGNNSDFYVDFLLENMSKTMASGKEETRIILGINNYDQFDLNVIEKWRHRFDIEHHYINTDTLPGSLGHAMVLETMLSKMNASYGAFVDCDIGFLMPAWDLIMVGELQKSPGVEAFGVEYTNKRKYQNFPNLTVCAFRPKFVQNLSIDFKPLLDPPSSEYVVKTQLESKAWDTPIGSTVVLDCGYQFPLKMCEAGAKGIALPHMGTGVLGVGQEHHYNGKPYLTHLKGSSIKDKNHPGALAWMGRIRQYISAIGL